MAVNKLGNINGYVNSAFNGNVYDQNGESPTIDTCGGGNRQPMIVVERPRQLRFIEHGTGKHQANTVYDVNTLSPAITTIQGGGTQQIKIVIEKDVAACAMRGRNPDNPTDRTAGIPTEQRIEINTEGVSNCLTSVQKDSMVLESSILTPKRTEYGRAIRKEYESGNIKESRHNMTQLEPRGDGISNTVTTINKDNLLLEKNKKDLEEQEVQYRIRKLTPRETWRLMDFSDEDYSKAAAVNSQTQMYKEAGNSIVRAVLMALFSQLNIQGIPTWNEKIKEDIEA
jgi:site-specific DNA-cytosine methylase